MQTPPPVDYLVVGHVTHDLLPGGGFVIGGTATYAALTAAALGRRVGVLTSCGPDFDAGPLTQAGVNVVRQAAPVTTTFENRYVDSHRQQRVHALAAPLTRAQLPSAWLQTPLVHIAPVIGECDAECATRLAAQFAGRSFVGLTLQGWLRKVNAQGVIEPAPWEEAARVLPLASAAVVSSEDVRGDWAMIEAFAARTRVLAVTQARQGGTLFVEGVARAFPAVAVTEVDPTGAGDIFAATFFAALALGAPPYAAALRSAQLASLSVTRPGLAGIPRSEEVRDLVFS